MDPAARRFLMMVAVGAGATGPVPIATRRGSFEKLMAFSKATPGGCETTDLRVACHGREIPLRIYRPRASDAASALIYCHGGGLVAGDLATHDALCRTLAQDAGCAVIAVDYRLAPEHPFPAAILDVLAAGRHVLRHAGALGLDPDRIGVGGDSGGATLAAVVARMMRTRLRAQVLLCPVLDMRGDYPSRRLFGEGCLLDAATMAGDLAHYAPHRGLDDPFVSPVRAEDLAGLPPAVIHSAGFDPLRDEAALYAARLAAAGVPVRHVCHAGMIHHFYGLTGVIPAARAALATIAADIRAALQPRPHGPPSAHRDR